ncbi:MAG: hypothetical protein ACHP65_09630 [Legionellales bacterium]
MLFRLISTYPGSICAAIGATINVAAHSADTTIFHEPVGDAATGAVMGASTYIGADMGASLGYCTGLVLLTAAVVARGKPPAFANAVVTTPAAAIGFGLGATAGFKLSYNFFSRNQTHHKNEQPTPISNTDSVVNQP